MDNYNDVINDHVRELIIVYKKTNDQEYFKDILQSVDKLLLKLIHRARQKMPYIKDVDANDLYQIAIIALYKAVEKMPAKEDPNKIPAWISSYLMAEVRKSYRYLLKEMNCLVEFTAYEVFSSLHGGFHQEPINTVDYEDFYKKGIITDVEYRTMMEYITTSKSINELADKEGISGPSVRNRVTRAIRKMKKEIKRQSLMLKFKYGLRKEK